MTPQEHWRSLVLDGRFSQGNPADPPAEFLAGVEFGKSHRELPQTDLIACAETALLLAGKATPGHWAMRNGKWVVATRGKHEGEILVAPTYWMESAPDEANDNAAFIANARTSLPILAQAVLDLTEKLEAVRASLEALTSDWQRQYGRFSESMGSDNPRLQAIDKRIADLDNLRLRITQTQPREGE